MRLNSFQRADILAKLDRGVCGNHLAEEYNVARSTISRLKKRKYNEMDKSEVSNPEEVWNYDQRKEAMNTIDSDDNRENRSHFASNANANDYHDDDNDEESDEPGEKSLTSLSSEGSKSESDTSEGNDSGTDSGISESSDEDDEDDDDEEDPNEICAELRCLWHSNRSLRAMIQLIVKLHRGGYIE